MIFAWMGQILFYIAGLISVVLFAVWVLLLLALAVDIGTEYFLMEIRR